MIGIIVDGDGDYASLKARYGAGIKVLKADGPRGHMATVNSIAVASKKQIAMLVGYGCKKIAILVDFEGRNQSASDFGEQISQAVRNATGVDVLVFVADQMIENWYLADILHVSRQKNFLRDLKNQRQYESTHGKNELKKIFKQGISYNEVRHGPEIFRLIRTEQASRMSASFRNFVAGLSLP